MTISVRDDNTNSYKKFKTINIDDLISYMQDYINIGDNYQICIGEDGDIFYMQKNNIIKNYNYITIINSCYIDYEDFYDSGDIDPENISQEELELFESEILDFVIDTKIEEFIDNAGQRYLVELE